MRRAGAIYSRNPSKSPTKQEPPQPPVSKLPLQNVSLNRPRAQQQWACHYDNQPSSSHKSSTQDPVRSYEFETDCREISFNDSNAGETPGKGEDIGKLDCVNAMLREMESLRQSGLGKEEERLLREAERRVLGY